MNTKQAPPRFANGGTLPHHQVVPADILALVSGVNLASVNKVILALNVVSDALGYDIEALTDPADLPAERADDTRYRNTERVAHNLSLSPEAAITEPYLHFIERMSRH